MKIVLMTGSHRRHLHVASAIARTGLVTGWVVENREEFVPDPTDVPERDRANFVRHFRERQEAEQTHLSPDAHALKDLNRLDIELPELNSDKVRSFVAGHAPDLLISFGIHKIDDDALARYRRFGECWNVHGGLSPWYRGTITLFWPFYYLQPHWAGMTVHELSEKLDAGGIVRHSVPELERGDGHHDVGAKAVARVSEDLVELVRRMESGGSVDKHPQKGSGKLFLNKDWRPEHLRVVYELFDNDMVDRYLDGELGGPAPVLIGTE